MRVGEEGPNPQVVAVPSRQGAAAEATHCQRARAAVAAAPPYLQRTVSWLAELLPG